MKRMSLMRKLLPAALVLPLLCAVSCRRSDCREVTINVYGMTNDLTARIVINALQYEICERQTDPNYNVDIKSAIVAYAADGALKYPAVQKCIEDATVEVGLPSKVISADPSPTRNWPGRHIARISVPEMKNAASANVVVAAIARAMRVARGVKEENVTIDMAAGTVTVKYESLILSTKNLEHAIAMTGLGTKNVPAKLGTSNSISIGW